MHDEELSHGWDNYLLPQLAIKIWKCCLRQGRPASNNNIFKSLFLSRGIFVQWLLSINQTINTFDSFLAFTFNQNKKKKKLFVYRPPLFNWFNYENFMAGTLAVTAFFQISVRITVWVLAGKFIQIIIRCHFIHRPKKKKTKKKKTKIICCDVTSEASFLWMSTSQSNIIGKAWIVSKSYGLCVMCMFVVEQMENGN